MSTQSSSPSSSGLVGWLAANRGAGGIALVVLGVAILVLPVTLTPSANMAADPATGISGWQYRA